MAWTERYCSPSGGGAHDGTSEANAWTLAEAISGVAAGQRVNVKAGTYASTTTTRTFGTAGTTTAPIWWRGYSSTIGDLDSDPATAKPAWTFTTGAVVISGAHQVFSNLSITGAPNSGTVLFTAGGGNVRIDRVRVESTAAITTSVVSSTTAGNVFSRCFFKGTSSATQVVSNAASVAFEGATFEGGGHGLAATSSLLMRGCVFRANGDRGCNVNAAAFNLHIRGCTFYGATNDGLRIQAIPAAGALVADCIFSANGAWGINQSSGTDSNVIQRSHNLFHSNSSGTETGFGDSPNFGNQTDSASPFTNAASGDLSLLSTSNARGNGLPGAFENESFTSYLDIGAVQRQEAGGGGLLRPVGLRGGLV